RLQPSHAVLCLVLRPDADVSQDGLHLVFATFLVTTACTACLVHGEQLLSPQFLVGALPYRVPFGVCLLQLLFELFSPLDDLADHRGIDSIDETAVLQHLACDLFAHHERLECLNRGLVEQQVCDLLTNMVVECANTVGLL